MCGLGLLARRPHPRAAHTAAASCAQAKIAKEAKEQVQECVSEFISFITSE